MVSVAFEEHGRARPRESTHLAAVVVAGFAGLSLVIAAFLYAGVYLHTPDLLTMPPAYAVHVLLNLACMWTVLAFGWQVHGELDRKLAETVFVALLAHGLLAFFILGGRWFFSRPVLLTNVLVSLVLGYIVVLLKHRISGPRLAVIRPLANDISISPHLGEVITSPAADLSKYDTILVSLSGGVSAEWARALSRAMLAGCQVRHVGEYLEEARGSVSLEHFELDQLTNVGPISYRSLKRFLDLTTVIFVLPVAALMIALGGLAVWLTMGHPVFFVQERVGLAGRTFRMWKLRTMIDPRPGEAARATIPGDARITRVGGFLRRFRIDELPQVWNVLKGDMSLIGPRPEAVSFHEQYVRDTPAWAYRNLVRPGITGWAQVSTAPSSNSEEARRKLGYDLYYVKRHSPFLDLTIALRTIWTVIMGGGVR